MILLAGSVSVGRAIVHLMRIDRGYGVKGVVTVNVSLDGTTHQLDKRQLPILRRYLIGSATSREFARPVPQNFFRCTPRPLSGDHSEWMGVRLDGTP